MSEHTVARMGQHRQRETFKRVADRVAENLLAQLRAGTLAKIGIDEIRAELRLQSECPLDVIAFDELEEMTTRAVVMKFDQRRSPRLRKGSGA